MVAGAISSGLMTHLPILAIVYREFDIGNVLKKRAESGDTLPKLRARRQGGRMARYLFARSSGDIRPIRR